MADNNSNKSSRDLSNPSFKSVLKQIFPCFAPWSTLSSLCSASDSSLIKRGLDAPSSPLPTSVLSKAAKGSSKPPSDKVNATDVVLIGDGSNSHTPPFLLTYEIYNRNLHNCLIDSGASSNIMPASVFSKLNIEPQKSAVHIVQLDRTKVKVLGEINSVYAASCINCLTAIFVTTGTIS